MKSMRYSANRLNCLTSYHTRDNREKNLSLSINRKDLVYLFLFIPFFFPEIISYRLNGVLVFLDVFGNVWRLASAGIVAAYYFLCSRKPCSGFILAVALYSAIMIVTSILMAGDVWISVIVFGTRVGMCMLLAMAMERRHLGAISMYLKVLLIINFVCMLLFPDGFDPTHVNYRHDNMRFFLGHKNALLMFMILALTLAFLQNGAIMNIKMKIWLVVFLLSEFLCTSSTGMVLAVFFVPLILCPFQWIKKLFAAHEFAIYFITTSASILLTLFYTKVTDLRVTQWLIEDVLGKQLTLSSRTLLWDMSWSRIFRSPWIGFGYVEGIVGGTIESPAHNAVLMVIYCTGMLGLAGLLVLFYVTSHKGHISNSLRTEHTWVSVAIFIVLLDGFMEPTVLSGHTLFCLMIFQYAINHGYSFVKYPCESRKV